MESVHYDITLPLGELPIRQVLTVKRFDSHGTLWFRLTHRGRPYRIAEDCMGVFTAKKPDGTVIYNPCSREGNAFVYALTPQTTAVPGQLRCELRLYGPGEKLITTAAFLLEVADTVYSGDEELASSQEAEALTQLIDESRQNIDEMRAVLNRAETLVCVDDTKIGHTVWTSRKLLDTLCPRFTTEGQIAVCTPVEGYPLQVVSHLDADTDSLELYIRGINFLSCDREISFTTSKIVTLEQPVPPGEYYLHIGAYTGSGEKQPTMIPYYEDGSMAPYLELGKEAYIAGRAVTFTKPVTQVRFYSNGTNGSTSSGISCTLLEAAIYVGNAKLPYEPYRSQVFTADFSKLTAGHGNPVFYDWNTGVTRESLDGEYYQHDPDTGEFYHISDIHNYESRQVRNILGFSGINCLNSTLGTVTVCGRNDPKELADKVSGQVNKQYELIEEFTLDADASEIFRNADSNGNAYDFSAMRIAAEVEASGGEAQFICTVFTTSPTSGAFYMPINGGVSTSKKASTFVIRNDKGFTDCFAVHDKNYNQQARASILASQWKNITKIRLFSGTEGINIPAGTRIRIYGIRG